ncbi:hypothetical protein [Leadbettera azotonutricia]|uniref:Uncharacterized protein n=1 Tax=Leadbettera azotonutricia (strain ATCC BAA-888 / DSM 13862 / ZAS-9) TaxID=545695 RepID=F5Y9I3_LEAAZ|nr:hypothetical protein [Leadbettera azotonutricia]AEF81179.1 hypothetical protein TREAZ_0856 [Leadbettera azotonutricia ZAS-9]
MKTGIKKILLVLIGSIAVNSAVLLRAMDWPLDAGTMRNNFGSNDNGSPLLGTSFETEDTVKAAENGELLYQHKKGDHASRLPSPLGSWLALDHGDGIISVYSRLDEEAPMPVTASAGKTASLGRSGISGWSGSKGFYFFLFDRKERRWINPSMIINPLSDTRQPLILSVRLKDSDGKLIDPSQTKTISQGRYLISVEATDTMLEARESPLAPFKIVCSVNGIETGALNFETYSARDGVLMVYRNGLIPVKQVYAPYPAYEVGEIRFTRGQATLEVIAQDIAGNSRNAVFRLQVE